MPINLIYTLNNKPGSYVHSSPLSADVMLLPSNKEAKRHGLKPVKVSFLWREPEWEKGKYEKCEELESRIKTLRKNMGGNSSLEAIDLERVF